jgi:hypothetical protein
VAPHSVKIFPRSLLSFHLLFLKPVLLSLSKLASYRRAPKLAPEFGAVVALPMMDNFLSVSRRNCRSLFQEFGSSNA